MNRALRIGLVVVLCCAGSFGADKRRDTKWVELRTAHFRVLSDGALERANAVGAQLECLRESLGVRSDDKTAPPMVIAFRRGSELREVGPLYRGKAVEVEGLYQIGEEFPFIAIDLTAQALAHVVAHEYSHLAMETADRPYPVWLLEGLSEYLAAAEGGEPSRRTRAFGSQILLTRLFAVREDSPEYNEERFHGSFYADAAVVAEYFWTDPERKSRLLSYLNLTRGGTPIEAAIRESFQMSSEEMSRAIRNFAAQPRSSVTASACQGKQANLNVVAVPDMDARAQIAELESKVEGRLRQSIGEFEAILREKPEHPTALRGIVYALWQSGDAIQASSYFRRGRECESHRLPAALSIRRDVERSRGREKRRG